MKKLIDKNITEINNNLKEIDENVEKIGIWLLIF